MPARRPSVHLAVLYAALAGSCLVPAMANPLNPQAALGDQALSEVRAAGWDTTALPWADAAARAALPGAATADDPGPTQRQAAWLAELGQVDRQAQQLRQWAASVGVTGAIGASGLAAVHFLAPAAPLLPVIGLPLFGLFPMLPPPRKG